MKYIFFKNLSIIKDKTWRILTSYFILIILINIFEKFNNLVLNINSYEYLLGLKTIKNTNIIFIITRLYKCAFYVYITYKLFTYDFIYSTYNTFLRFSRKKWVINKTLSIVSIIFIFKLFEYILTAIFFHFNFKILINLFIIDLLNTLTISLIIIFINLLRPKFKVLIILLSILVLIKYLLINICDIKIIVFLIIISILVLLIYYNSKNILKN